MAVTLPPGVGKRDSMQIVQRQRKAVLCVAIAAIIFALLFSRSRWAFDERIHTSIEMAGLALVAIAIVGRVWCSMYLGGRKKRMVVNTGPFSIVRNPLYVFSVIGAAGVGLFTGSFVIAFMLAFVIWFVFDGVISREEQYLRENLGEPYLEYLSSTPRWIPAFSQWSSAETLEVRPNLMWRTLRDALWFVIAFPLLEVLEYAQVHNWLPVVVRLP
jgi:protein-S-isoprenylcysteine O-methyltransferase Ste14